MVSTMRSRSRGVALVYTLMISAVLVAFLAAVLVRVTQTLRFTAYDEDFVKARHLADSGARYTILMMRDVKADFYAGKLPLSSTTLGPTFSPESLGGTFEVQVHETSELGANPYPAAGTYRTIVSTGKVRGRTARTVATVKVTSPLVNYLALSRGDFWIGVELTQVHRIEGPILTLANPAANQRGDVRIWHMLQYFDVTPNRFATAPGDIEIAAEIKAAGRIYVQNLNDDPNWTTYHGSRERYPPLPGPRNLDGEYEPKDFPGANIGFESPDITFVVPEKWRGKVTLLDDLNAQPNHEFGAKVPEMADVIKRFREKPGVKTIDISNYPQGVLVEFHGGKMSVSTTQRKLVGRMFDAYLLDDHQGTFINELGWQFGGGNRNRLRERLHDEVAWNDPMFPDAPYPDGYVDWNDNGVPNGKRETHGDYFDVYRLERVATFETVNLSRGDWTTIRFVTSRTDYPSADGGPTTGPPLYLRGLVQGKATVVYDVTDDNLDPGYTKTPMLILGEHEAGDDSPGNKLAGVPGIPGGLVYADRSYKNRADARGAGSQDALVLVSRGQIYGAGQPGFYLDNLRRGTNFKTRYDYRQVLHDRDVNYSRKYGSGSDDPDFLVTTESTSSFVNLVRTPLYGVAIENGSVPLLRLSGTGELVLDFPLLTHPNSGSALKWADLEAAFGTSPDWRTPPGNPTETAAFPLRFRNARTADGSRWRLTGSYHGLGGAPYLNGSSRFDYKYQALQAQEIEDGIGLPLSVLVVGWLRQ